LLKVADLVQMDHLGLTVLSGQGGLERRVLWAHVAEIEDIADWLDGGEFLMTSGGGLPASPSKQVAYVQRLAEVRAAGLAIGQRSPEISSQMLEEAERLDLPVLSVRAEIPYLEISQLVAAANADTAQSRIATQLRIYDSLRSRVDRRRSLAELFSHLEDITGYDLYVVSDKGRSLFAELPDAPDSLPPRLPDLTDRSPTIPGGVGVPIPLADRTAAYLLALERDGGAAAGLGAIRHIATVAALELANLYRERDEALQRGGDALADLFAAEMSREQADRALIANGLASDRPLLLVTAKSHKPHAPTTVRELNHLLVDAQVPAMVLSRPEGTFMLIQDEDEEKVQDALERAELYAGLSQPFTDPLAISVARMQATWAAQWPSSSRVGAMTRFEESSGWMTWLPHDAGALRTIIDHTLAPIAAYDAENDTELVHTLRVFFRNERNIGRTAEQLFIHKHTLQYRLRRIREISGRSMASTQDLAELWFTFQAEALIRADALDP
jgi:purine catabolism regulator